MPNMDLEIWFKFHTNTSKLEAGSLETTVCQIPSCTYYLKEAEMKISLFAHFKEYHENHKKI